MFDRRGERTLIRAERQPRRLLGVVHTAQIDATMVQVGEIEGRVVNNRGDALQQP